jgi:hypothetical protein
MGNRPAQHVFQPMCSGILARDEKAVEVTILIEKEIAQIGTQDFQSKMELCIGIEAQTASVVTIS